MKTIPRASAVVFLALAASAKDIHVARDGSGDYSTFAKALEASVPGDVIVIKKASGMVGAVLKLDKGAIIIDGTVAGSPAEAAGLRKGERLVAVDGKDLTGATVADAVARVRGPVGTSVILRLSSVAGVREEAIIRGEVRREVKDDLTKAGIAYEQGDYETALRYARKSADSGAPDGQAFLASLHLNGKGTRKDASQAFSWAAKAASAGDVDGMRLLGSLYKSGAGVPRDPALAVSWLKKAADKNDARSQVLLAEAYETGDGVRADRDAAIAMCRRALVQELAPELASATSRRLERLEKSR